MPLWLLREYGTFSVSRCFGAACYQISHLQLPSLLWPNRISNLLETYVHLWKDSKQVWWTPNSSFLSLGVCFCFVKPNSTFSAASIMTVAPCLQLWSIWDSTCWNVHCWNWNNTPKFSFVLSMTTWRSTCFDFVVSYLQLHSIWPNTICMLIIYTLQQVTYINAFLLL